MNGAPGSGEGSGAARLVPGAAGLALHAADGTVVRAATELLGAPRRGRDLLARAVRGALRSGAGEASASDRAEVVDATAGLGADSFHLASLGLRVTMIERVPLVAALLADALARAAAGQLGEAARLAAANLSLVQADATEVLTQRLELGERPAVVYLDPMYPKQGKAALPGKGMALFRDLVGSDADSARLLAAAQRAATRRVVVKRPLKAPFLGDLEPSGSLAGGTTRYDLYPPAPGSGASE
ncbi:MAG: class I SAM-dependent methyltransferase [Trueperaceae bacterium]